jgi:predicted ArsR family transcriptional regulator
MGRNAVVTLLARVASLEDPVRRALYFLVVERGGETSRDQAARGVGVSRALAAFHLDRLVRAGLLEVTYRRLHRRRGPGAGRPSKLYRRAAIQLSLSLPPREYELAAELFAEAFTGPRAKQQLDRVARRVGRRLAVAAHTKGRRALVSVLARHGYEPSTAAGGSIVLRNCPFDALARTHRDLMCGTNRALVEGLRRGAGLAGYEVVATSEPGRCCATIRPR